MGGSSAISRYWRAAMDDVFVPVEPSVTIGAPTAPADHALETPS